ncbi:MAG: protein-L-isoaspartate O-methyltransferase [Rhodobacteraceae bacterium]|nr:protein-L-isoaspartate O-methyltransferase [Paracoccaceae bacterium]
MSDYALRRTMMVDTQVRPNDVTKFPIIEAMLTIPREEFVPERARAAAYVGENIDLAPGRVLLEPRTLSKLLDAMDVQSSDKVLVVGGGLGYSAAVIGRMAAQVVAIEEDAGLAETAAVQMASLGITNVLVRQGVLAEGAAVDGPYDRVILEGAVEEIPVAITSQVREGGRIAAIFMQGALGVARIGHKIDGQINWRFAFNAAAPVLPGFAAKRVFAL